MQETDIFEKDRKYFIQGIERTKLVIVEGKGAVLKDINGTEFIDCFAGIAVTNVGHAPERLGKVATEQFKKLIHCSGKFYTIPQTLLAEKLANITPNGLQRSYLCSSGTEAVENAIKIAKKFAIIENKTGAALISLELSFHGRLGVSLSLTGQGKYKKGFETYCYSPGVVHAPVPYPYRSPFDPEECGERAALAVEEVIDRQTTGDVAAMIFEPILGEGGIIVPPDSYFKTVTAILKEREIPLIIDEVQTGFARTGKLFASEHWNLTPDIMTLAKGLGGGMPIGAVIATDRVGKAIKPGELFSTYSGNPICAAVALENINLLQDMDLVKNASNIGKIFMDGLSAIQKKNNLIGDVRGKGLMIGIELVKDQKKKTPAKKEAKEITLKLLKKGVIMGLGGFYGNVLRLQPPLVISEEQANQVLERLETVFA